MEKLTLEYVAPYLPYGLKVFSGIHPSKQMKDIWDLVGINPTQKNLNPSYWGERSDYNNVIAIYPITPILRPMDLTKPIIVEGKEIIPIVDLLQIIVPNSYAYPTRKHGLINGSENILRIKLYPLGNDIIMRDDKNEEMYYNQLALFQWLFKNKFDVFGLIEKGLAIDVNTLTTNPYN